MCIRDNAKGALAQEQARYRQTERDLKRIRELQKKGFASESELDNAVSNYCLLYTSGGLVLEALPGLLGFLFGRQDQQMAVQDVSHSAGGNTAVKDMADLASAPRRMRLTQRNHLRFQRGRGPLGAIERPAGFLVQAISPALFVSLKPLVSRLRADTEASAQFSPCLLYTSRCV